MSNFRATGIGPRAQIAMARGFALLRHKDQKFDLLIAFGVERRLYGYKGRTDLRDRFDRACRWLVYHRQEHQRARSQCRAHPFPG